MKKLKKLTAFAAALMVSTSLLIGCGGSTDNSKVINVFNCADYIDEALISKFEKETGYKVNYDKYDTNEIMYNKLKNGNSNYDLVFPSDYMIEKMISEDMVEKINFDNVPNYKYIDDKFKNLSYDPTNEYSVPYMWGTIGIIYNSEVVKEPVNSWDILWDEKYKDEIVLFDSIRDTMAIGLKKAGYSMNSTNPDEIKTAADELIAQKPLSRSYVVDQVKDLMISGEVAIATVWSGDAYYCISKNENLKFVVPSEGSNKWFDAMVIPKGGNNKEGAEAFINFLTDPENAKQNVDYIEYYTPNKATYKMLDEEVKATYPSDDILDKCEVFRNLDNETLQLYDDSWTRVKNSK